MDLTDIIARDVFADQCNWHAGDDEVDALRQMLEFALTLDSCPTRYTTAYASEVARRLRAATSERAAERRAGRPVR